MSQSGRYETILGQLGAYLACQDARRVEIADEGIYLTVSWLSQGATRRFSTYREEEIARLQASGRRDPNDMSSRAALLGVLGRRLDESGMDVARIEEKTDSFQISGATCGRYSNQRVGYWELRTQPAAAPKPAAEESSVPPVEAMQSSAMAAVQPSAAAVVPTQANASASEPQPVAPGVLALAFLPAIDEPASKPTPKSGPATEILSRELRPLPPPTFASPLRRRIGA